MSVPKLARCKMCPFVDGAANDPLVVLAVNGSCDRLCFYCTILIGTHTPIDAIPDDLRDDDPAAIIH